MRKLFEPLLNYFFLPTFPPPENVDIQLLTRVAEKLSDKFNNIEDVYIKFSQRSELHQIGSQPATGHLHLFFMERALGNNPSYRDLKKTIIENQIHKEMPVTANTEEFESGLLDLCDTYIERLQPKAV